MTALRYLPAVLPLLIGPAFAGEKVPAPINAPASIVSGHALCAAANRQQASDCGAAPLLPGAAAGGDLSGTYPNPTVAKINGTTAGALATLGAGTGLTSSAGNLNATGVMIGVQVFATHGSYTFTPDAGTNSVIVEGCGAGASGTGASASTATNNASAGPGGGNGGIFKVRLTSGFSGASVTIGTGGATTSAGGNGNAGTATTFGTGIAANGGNGTTVSVVNTAQNAIGGTGGTVSLSAGTALVSFKGPAGKNSWFSSTRGWSGGGADGPYGSGGQQIIVNNASIQTAGTAAAGNCAGGGGGLSADDAAGTAQTGGAGGDGLIIVWEFS